MITSDKKKSALLGLLVILAVLSWYFVMRPGMTTATLQQISAWFQGDSSLGK